MRLAAGMDRLEEHRGGVVKHVLSHDGGAGDLGLPDIADPARHLLAVAGAAARGQLGGAQPELAIVDTFDDAERRPCPGAAEPSNRLDQ